MLLSWRSNKKKDRTLRGVLISRAKLGETTLAEEPERETPAHKNGNRSKIPKVTHRWVEEDDDDVRLFLSLSSRVTSCSSFPFHSPPLSLFLFKA